MNVPGPPQHMMPLVPGPHARGQWPPQPPPPQQFPGPPQQPPGLPHPPPGPPHPPPGPLAGPILVPGPIAAAPPQRVDGKSIQEKSTSPIETTVKFFSTPFRRFLLCLFLVAVSAFGYSFVGVAVLSSLGHPPYTAVIRQHKRDLLITTLIGLTIVFGFFAAGFVIVLSRWRASALGRESIVVLVTAAPFTFAVGYGVPTVGFLVHPGNLYFRHGFMAENMLYASSVGMSIVVGGLFMLFVVVHFVRYP